MATMATLRTHVVRAGGKRLNVHTTLETWELLIYPQTWYPRPPGTADEGSRGVAFHGLEPLYLIQMAFDLGSLVAAWHLAFRPRLAINPWLSLQFTHEQLTAVAPSLGGLLTLWAPPICG